MTVVLLMIIGIIVLIEKITMKNLITPSIVLGIPLLIAVLLNALFSRSLGFHGVGLKSVLFIVVNLFLFVLVGQIIRAMFTRNKKLVFRNRHITQYLKLNFLVKFIALVSIILSARVILGELLGAGIYLIGSKDFLSAYGSGITAHIRNFSMFSFFYFGYDWANRKNKTSLLISILLLLSVIVYQAKYQLIWIILGLIYLLYFEGKIKFTIKRVLSISVILFLSFSIVYVISLGSRLGFSYVLSKDFMVFLAKHFYFYITSSTQALDLLLDNTSLMTNDIRYFIMVPYNIYAKLYNLEFVNIIHGFVAVSTDKMTNVYTMFGSIYMNIGYIGTLTITVIISTCSYILYFLSLRSTNIYLKIMNAFNLALLTSGFFGFDYNKFLVLETIFALCIMMFLSRITTKKKYLS